MRCWMSIGAGSGSGTGWRHNVMADSFGICNWTELPRVIRETARRFIPPHGNPVQIENRDAFEMIGRYSRENVLMYLDPPYVPKSRSKKKIYGVEMGDAEHIRLCGMINQSPAKIILSCYANELYDKHLRGFNRVSVKTKDESGKDRTEILWFNFTTTGNLFEGGEDDRPV